MNTTRRTMRHAQRFKYWNEWLAAMHEELEALEEKGVLYMVKSLSFQPDENQSSANGSCTSNGTRTGC
jgi:hypothetical protein